MLSPHFENLNDTMPLGELGHRVYRVFKVRVGKAAPTLPQLSLSLIKNSPLAELAEG
jgi:hypothetical protein